MAKARLPANWLRSARDALLPAASATVVEERHGSESWWGGEIRQRQSSQQQADSCSALTGTRRSITRKGMFAELADADSPAAHAVVSVADRMGGGCRGPTVLRHHQPQVLVAFCGWYRTYSINPCRHTLSKSILGQPACTMSASCEFDAIQ